MLRWAIGAAFALSIALPASAQQAAAPVEDPLAAVQQQLLATQQQLLAAQQEIATLRREAADARDQAAQLAAVREKNVRLVAIGNELIAAYGKRYRRGHFAPFETGRVKFETELQEASGRVYDNRADAGPRRAAPPPEAPAAPASDTPPDPAPDAPAGNP